MHVGHGTRVGQISTERSGLVALTPFSHTPHPEYRPISPDILLALGVSLKFGGWDHDHSV